MSTRNPYSFTLIGQAIDPIAVNFKARVADAIANTAPNRETARDRKNRMARERRAAAKLSRMTEAAYDAYCPR